MSNKQRLIEYYNNICDVLNTHGYRIKTQMGGKIYESKYSVDEQNPDLTAMAITDDNMAYRFLKQENIINKSLCHFCGNSPIDNTYTFTEPKNMISLNICESCHSKGQSVTSSKGGCFATFAVIAFIILVILVV